MAGGALAQTLRLWEKDGICGFGATLGSQCLKSKRARICIEDLSNNYTCLASPLISIVLKSYFAPGGCSDRTPLKLSYTLPTSETLPYVPYSPYVNYCHLSDSYTTSGITYIIFLSRQKFCLFPSPTHSHTFPTNHTNHHKLVGTGILPVDR